MKKFLELDCYDSFKEAKKEARKRFSKYFTKKEMDECLNENVWMVDDGFLVYYYCAVSGSSGRVQCGRRWCFVKLQKEEEEVEEECDECRLVPRAED